MVGFDFDEVDEVPPQVRDLARDETGHVLHGRSGAHDRAIETVERLWIANAGAKEKERHRQKPGDDEPVLNAAIRIHPATVRARVSEALCIMRPEARGDRLAD